MNLSISTFVGWAKLGWLQTCKATDAETVGGVELTHEKLAASLSDRGDLQQTGGWQQHLHMTPSTIHLYHTHNTCPYLPHSHINHMNNFAIEDYIHN